MHSFISVMSHISAPQQEGGSRSSEETIAPIFPLFTALKAAYIDNQQLLEKLDAFLQSEERKALAKLKDSTAEEAINLLDKVCEPTLTTILSCG